MTKKAREKKRYVFWRDVLEELRWITDHIQMSINPRLFPGIDFGDPIAERIRQLGRDMTAPTGPVIHEPKEEE